MFYQDQPAEGRSNNTGRSEDDLRKVSKHDEELMVSSSFYLSRTDTLCILNKPERGWGHH